MNYKYLFINNFKRFKQIVRKNRKEKKIKEKEIREKKLLIFFNSLKDGSNNDFINSMIDPMRQRLDYEGIACRAVAVDPLPQGALPYLYKENNV